MLRVQSEKYQDAGFKEFTFGMTREEVESQIGELSPGPESFSQNWRQSKKGDQLLLFEHNALRGIIKMYHGDDFHPLDVEAYTKKFVDLFGRVPEGNITQATFVNERLTQSHARVYWTFAKSLVGHKHQDPIVLTIHFDPREQQILLSLVDWDWARTDS